MVCSWGLVKAYQQTQQNCLRLPALAPHIMKAYNHKVNHDTHKELGPQEHVQPCSMPTLCSLYPSAMIPGIRTVWHQQSKTSGWRLLSLLEVGLSATWTPHTSWVMQCTQTEGPRFQTIIMYGLPSPHKSESSSVYDKKGDARTDVVANYL